jgi:hypothetical protein
MPIVLIASAARLDTLTGRSEYREALAFADTDALRAFAAIARQHPDLIVLESAFAASSPGAALINRIKADATIADCEIRILAGDRVTSEPAPAVFESSSPDPGQQPVQAGPAATSGTNDPPVPPVDVTTREQAPVAAIAREQPRTAVAALPDSINGMELLVDGSPATLVDLSTGGAQVMSASSLKPNQRVRLTLPGSPPIRVNGEITWAVFEMPGGAPRYRAGVAFVDPDTAGILAFIHANRK